MKLKARVWAVSLAGGVLLFGCAKSEPVSANSEYYGVRLDWAPLSTRFTNATAEAQATAYAAVHAFRCGQFAEAKVQLEKLSKDQVISAEGKAFVNDLIEKTSQVIARTPSAAQ